MTCKQLGGACDQEFTAETFEEIAKKSQEHGIKMFQEGDEAHIKAMQEMREMMSDPEAMQKWIQKKRKEFESLPEDN